MGAASSGATVADQR